MIIKINNIWLCLIQDRLKIEIILIYKIKNRKFQLKNKNKNKYKVLKVNIIIQKIIYNLKIKFEM